MANLFTTKFKGTDITAASTITVPTDGDRLDVTGTTGITAIHTSGRHPGSRFYLTFIDGLTLTNGADLALRGATDYEAAAGDTLLFEAVADNSVAQIVLANNERSPHSAVAATDAATIAIDASLGDLFTVTITDDRTLGAPSNGVAGQRIIVAVTQDGTGSRALAYTTTGAGKIRFGADVVSPSLSTDPDKTDYLGFVYNADADAWDCVSVAKGY